MDWLLWIWYAIGLIGGTAIYRGVINKYPMQQKLVMSLGYYKLVAIGAALTGMAYLLGWNWMDLSRLGLAMFAGMASKF